MGPRIPSQAQVQGQEYCMDVISLCKSALELKSSPWFFTSTSVTIVARVGVQANATGDAESHWTWQGLAIYG